jgi:hypothetical protein
MDETGRPVAYPLGALCFLPVTRPQRPRFYFFAGWMK